MSDLIERLEKATGPDREIDAALVKALCPDALVSQYLASDEEPSVFHAQSLGISDRSDVPRYTASLDAALTLVERALPGTEWAVSTLYGVNHAEVDMNGEEPVTARDAATPAIALCLATMKALSAARGTDSPQAEAALSTETGEKA